MGRGGRFGHVLDGAHSSGKYQSADSDVSQLQGNASGRDLQVQRLMSLRLYSLYEVEQHHPECNGNFVLVCKGGKKDTNKNSHDDM